METSGFWQHQGAWSSDPYEQSSIYFGYRKSVRKQGKEFVIFVSEREPRKGHGTLSIHHPKVETGALGTASF